VGALKYKLKSFEAGVELCFIAPNTLKLHVAKDGKATKKEMENAVKKILGLESVEESVTSHQVDAMALVLFYEEYLKGNFDEAVSRQVKGRSYKC
jgi:Holliday junction resolvasome RuvABC endonuclease subunit